MVGKGRSKGVSIQVVCKSQRSVGSVKVKRKSWGKAEMIVTFTSRAVPDGLFRVIGIGAKSRGRRRRDSESSGILAAHWLPVLLCLNLTLLRTVHFLIFYGNSTEVPVTSGSISDSKVSVLSSLATSWFSLVRKVRRLEQYIPYYLLAKENIWRIITSDCSPIYLRETEGQIGCLYIYLNLYWYTSTWLKRVF
ncbi:hypothetical protein M501DRAFT_533958 [Patellaria atrata CBS 101060]|uniref:Uncharacterized protein n=1 Tax=Patellaria atrata CBS 101060 TaxID=1346257 RepID=A0A9P4SF51_9PEZI|nr:hypothetical protein M501DRAFT_533958 [Patellaria atrata CBS 101060]